jgi:hypothetical protein
MQLQIENKLLNDELLFLKGFWIREIAFLSLVLQDV